MRAWIVAMVFLAACKGGKDKETTAPPKTAGPAVPAVKVASVLAKEERHPPFLLLVDDAGTVRLAAAKSWEDLDANTLTIAKRATVPERVRNFVREAYELQRDPVEAIPQWDQESDGDLGAIEDTATGSGAQDDPPPPPPEDMPDDESGGTGTAMALDEGKMGQKDADRAEGQYKMQKNQEDPQLARQQAIEQARAAGILGSAPNGVGGAFARLPNDDGSPGRRADVAGAVRKDGKLDRLRAIVLVAPTTKASKLIDTVRETQAAIGVVNGGKVRPLNLDFGIRDSIAGGSPAWLEARVSTKGIVVEAVPDKPFDVAAIDQLGATVEKARAAHSFDADAPVDVLVDGDVDAQRLVDVIVALDVAGVKTIGMGGPLTAEELARRGHRITVIQTGQPVAQGDLDKKEIRKVVKGAKAKITYCYEKQLVSQPTLAGTVQVQFFITPKGDVASAIASGVSPEVAGCVANVIKSLQFPKPKGGGGVQVNYPFVMHQ